MSFISQLAEQFRSAASQEVPPAVATVLSGDAKKIAGMLWDVGAPIPVQAALYSPEAEAAFIGPKGIKNLEAAGLADKLRRFTSRFFGERAEINPSNVDLVSNAMFGGPHGVAKARQAARSDWDNKTWKLLEARTSGMPAAAFSQKMLQASAEKPKDLVAADFLEGFPELVTAYPQLKKVPVEVRSRYKGNELARFEPLHSIDRRPLPDNLLDAIEKVTGVKDLNAAVSAGKPVDKKAFEAANARKYFVREMAKDRAEQKAQVGKITVSLPDEALGDYPGIKSYESILHEIQHAIQKYESGLSGKEFLDSYEAQSSLQPYGTQNLIASKNGLQDKLEKFVEKAVARVDAGGLSDAQASQLMDKASAAAARRDAIERNFHRTWEPYYEYSMNPYEREAFEASKRDVNPQYRDFYVRKTELLDRLKNAAGKK